MGTLSKWQLSRRAARGTAAALPLFRGEMRATTFLTPVYTCTGVMVGVMENEPGSWLLQIYVTLVMAPPNICYLGHGSSKYMLPWSWLIQISVTLVMAPPNVCNLDNGSYKYVTWIMAPPNICYPRHGSSKYILPGSWILQMYVTWVMAPPNIYFLGHGSSKYMLPGSWILQISVTWVMAPPNISRLKLPSTVCTSTCSVGYVFLFRFL